MRSIGVTARDIASRTGVLLADLVTIPGVRIFLSARPAGTTLPPVPHVVSVGRRIILVESVCWPSGNYNVVADGRVHCDGVYIGQSTVALTAAVHAWRNVLTRDHDVRAVVVVHATGKVRLPAGVEAQLNWSLAEDAVLRIKAMARAVRGEDNLEAIAALVAAVSRAGDVPPLPQRRRSFPQFLTKG